MSPERARGDIILDHISHVNILVSEELFKGLDGLGVIFHSGREIVVEVYELLVDSPVKRFSFEPQHDKKQQNGMCPV